MDSHVLFPVILSGPLSRPAAENNMLYMNQPSVTGRFSDLLIPQIKIRTGFGVSESTRTQSSMLCVCVV